MVRPALPAPFTAKIDSVSVSRFVLQLNICFRIVELNDDVKMGQIAIMLLEGATYNWLAL